MTAKQNEAIILAATYQSVLLCCFFTEAEATAGVGRPEDPLSGTLRSRFSAAGKAYF